MVLPRDATINPEQMSRHVTSSLALTRQEQIHRMAIYRIMSPPTLNFSRLASFAAQLAIRPPRTPFTSQQPQSLRFDKSYLLIPDRNPSCQRFDRLQYSRRQLIRTPFNFPSLINHFQRQWRSNTDSTFIPAERPSSRLVTYSRVLLPILVHAYFLYADSCFASLLQTFLGRGIIRNRQGACVGVRNAYVQQNRVVIGTSRGAKTAQNLTRRFRAVYFESRGTLIINP